MTNRPVAAQRSDDIVQDVTEHLPEQALIHSLVWKPRFLLDSTIITHLPLLNWLTGVLRPRSVRVIGADDGIAHFAFCQSLDQLGIEGDCRAYGFWPNTDHDTKSVMPPDSLLQHQAMLYESISQLVPCSSLEEAFSQFPQGSVDLLFCDLTVLPSTNHLTGERLSKCLSPTGVLILHGITGKQRTEFADFVESRRHFTLPAAEGIAVVSEIDEWPLPIRSIFQTTSSGLLRRDVVNAFRQCGQRLKAVAAVSVATQTRKAAESSAAEAWHIVDCLRVELEALRSTHTACSARLAEAEDTISRLRAENDTIQQAKAKASAEADAAHSAQAEAALSLAVVHSELEAERGTRFSETAALTRIAQDLKDRLAMSDLLKSRQTDTSAALAKVQSELQAERKARRSETDALRHELETSRTSHSSTTTALARRTHERDLLIRQRDALARRIKALTNSTSWRVTSPLRAIRQTLGLGRD